MHIVAITMVRNDADIVEAFVRHALRLVDHLFVVVHSPQDGTDRILDALWKEGLALSLIADPEPGFHQMERMTAMARHAFAARPADFVFALDADEFLLPDSRSAIEGALGKLPPDAPAGRLPVRNFAPLADDPADEPNPVRRIRNRFLDEPQVCKVVLTRAFPADPALVVDMGNHAVLRAAAALPPQPILDGLSLAHYPVRTPSQLTTKAVIGFLSHLAVGRAKDRELGNAVEWRRIFQEMASARQPQRTSFEERVAMYYQKRDSSALRSALMLDPTAAPYELRYGGLGDTDPYVLLARFAETLARNHGTLARERRGAVEAAPAIEYSAGYRVPQAQQLKRSSV